VSIKENVIDFDPQPVITKDNVTMQIDTVVYYQITDGKLFTYGVERPINAIENLTATTLRNIIGELELDETLTSRDLINTRMRSILDEATDPWGIKVNRVEVKNILPPPDIQDAMEKQMRAEREKATILTAEARKEAAVREAEGEAEAILKLQQATAKGLSMLKAAQVDNAVIQLKSLEALAKVADGQSTKLIIPSNIQDMAGLVASLKEIGTDK
jgi:regulator of protease activity HflC (stomatin/prohibitin superfamily)